MTENNAVNLTEDFSRESLNEYIEKFNEYFSVNSKVAVAFSGGVDSAYLLYAAATAGADVKAYYVRTAFQPQFEVNDAVKVVEYVNKVLAEDDRYEGMKPVELQFIDLDVLADENVVCNSERRCYFCKKQIMGTIIKAASADGYEVLLDGNNASDDTADRPGMAATAELGIRSPLRELGATKPIVRQLSAYAGLFTAGKPAYACLATRILTGQVITQDKLSITELSESYLYKLGFRDFRIRMRGDAALIQVKADQLSMMKSRFSEVEAELLKHYSEVMLDDATR